MLATASLICEMPTSCSVAPAPMPPTSVLICRTAASASSMELQARSVCRVPASTLLAASWISSLISCAATDVLLASWRTSPATTAKPRPCSPARAASTAAFSASRLVCSAMPSMTWTISWMRREAWLMVCIVSVTRWTAFVLREVMSDVCKAMSATPRALSALWRTVAVICVIDADVWTRLDAWDSVRSDSSRLPRAISPAVPCSDSTPARVSPTIASRLTDSWLSARSSRPARPG